jgi:hypothetical protein
METGTLITGLVMLALCALPFVLIYFNRKKTKEQMLFSISKMVSHEAGKLTDYEYTTNAIIGMDSEQNKVFLYKKHKDRETRELLNLVDFQKCEIEKLFSHEKNQNDTEIEKVNLKFYPKAKEGKPISVEFYNANESFNLKDELEFAKNWEKKINKQMELIA